jgi:hypothetical protein
VTLMKIYRMVLMAVATFTLAGCASGVGNVGQVYSSPVAGVEAAWIRNGEPIEFEEGLWYPRSDIEVFQDFEMLQVGEFRGVSFFVAKIDVRPYRRLYTKFGRNQFRYFEKEPAP